MLAAYHALACQASRELSCTTQKVGTHAISCIAIRDPQTQVAAYMIMDQSCLNESACQPSTACKELPRARYQSVTFEPNATLRGKHQMWQVKPCNIASPLYSVMPFTHRQCCLHSMQHPSLASVLTAAVECGTYLAAATHVH